MEPEDYPVLYRDSVIYGLIAVLLAVFLGLSWLGG